MLRQLRPGDLLCFDLYVCLVLTKFRTLEGHSMCRLLVSETHRVSKPRFFTESELILRNRYALLSTRSV